MSAQVPSVEDRLFRLEQLLALVTLVNRALGHGGDLCLSSVDVGMAHCLLSDLAEGGLKHVKAVQQALPGAEGMCLEAPDAAGGR